MEFQQVFDLVPGKKYKVVHHFHEYTATYKNSIMYNPIMLTFTTKERQYHQYIFPGQYKFPGQYNPYKYFVPIFKKERIQSDMEQRALQRILKNIIGDESFSW
jgi:hypothetical protein